MDKETKVNVRAARELRSEAPLAASFTDAAVSRLSAASTFEYR